MPTFTIERVLNEPIVIVTEQDSYNATEHLDDLINAVVAEVEGFDRPGYIIAVQKAGYTVNDIIEGAATMRTKGEKLRNNPKYRGSLFVTSVKFNKMALEGMSSEALGSLRYTIFDTLDEALTYARSTL